MKENQNRVPLIEALDGFIEKEPALFCIPGHRAERGVPEPLLERFGEAVFGYDLTEAEGLDDLHSANGAIREAQELLAELYGAEKGWFVVNGSTAAVEAMVMAAAGPGEKILAARNIHKSALSGLILSGAEPVWLPCEYDSEWKVAGGIKASDVEKMIQEYPEVKAVFLVSPTYYGVNSELKAIAEVCHQHGLPLLVDAAHGSHLRFGNMLPEDAVSAGADLTAMSLHKTAGAMTQASVLLYRPEKETVTGTDEETGEEFVKEIKKEYIDIEKLEAALKITQSSSPSYVLMASLDGARQQLALHGEEMIREAAEMAMDLRRALEQTPGIRVLGGSDAAELLEHGIDATRVTFRAEGISGVRLKERLFDEGQALEMADDENVVAVITAGNTSQDILKLSMAVWSASNGAEEKEEKPLFDLSVIPEAAMTPRNAYFAPKEKIGIRQAEGRICGTFLCPYPPGTPVVVPGEILTGPVIEFLTFCRDSNIPMHGWQEDGTIEVVKQEKAG